MAKYYAVKAGRIPGIYNSWDECKKQTQGFSGAEFKSFVSEKEALEYLNQGNENAPRSKENFLSESTESYVAYVDGSFDDRSGRYSCGVIILHDGEEIYSFCEAGENKDAASMRNVAGELLGSVRAVEYALRNHIPEIVICHDYEGIGAWADKRWKANRVWTKNYADFIEKSRKRCNIKFKKVKGHSNNKYNDKVDMLAKQALGLNT